MLTYWRQYEENRDSKAGRHVTVVSIFSPLHRQVLGFWNWIEVCRQIYIAGNGMVFYMSVWKYTVIYNVEKNKVHCSKLLSLNGTEMEIQLGSSSQTDAGRRKYWWDLHEKPLQMKGSDGIGGLIHCAVKSPRLFQLTSVDEWADP